MGVLYRWPTLQHKNSSLHIENTIPSILLGHSIIFRDKCDNLDFNGPHKFQGAGVTNLFKHEYSSLAEPFIGQSAEFNRLYNKS